MYYIHVLARVYVHMRAHYWQRCPPTPQHTHTQIIHFLPKLTWWIIIFLFRWIWPQQRRWCVILVDQIHRADNGVIKWSKKEKKPSFATFPLLHEMRPWLRIGGTNYGGQSDLSHLWGHMVCRRHDANSHLLHLQNLPQMGVGQKLSINYYYINYFWSKMGPSC